MADSSLGILLYIIGAGLGGINHVQCQPSAGERMTPQYATKLEKTTNFGVNSLGLKLSLVDDLGKPLANPPSLNQVVRIQIIRTGTHNVQGGARIRYVSCAASVRGRDDVTVPLIDADGCPWPGSGITSGFIGDDHKAISGEFRLFSLHGQPDIDLKCRIQLDEMKTRIKDYNHCQRHGYKRLRRQSEPKSQTVGANINIVNPELEDAKKIIEAAKLKSSEVCLGNTNIIVAVALPSAVAIFTVFSTILFCILTLRLHRRNVENKNKIKNLEEQIAIQNQYNGFIPSSRRSVASSVQSIPAKSSFYNRR